MANNIEWEVIENSQSKEKNKHVILVAYQPMGGGMNDIVAVFPMYDLRDYDLSGSASFQEKAWTEVTKLVDPLYIFGLMNAAGNASCMIDAAVQKRDYFLQQAATAGLLRDTWNLRHEIMTAVMMKSFLSAHIKVNLTSALTLANCGMAELVKIGGVGTFIIQAALEATIMNAVLALPR